LRGLAAKEAPPTDSGGAQKVEPMRLASGVRREGMSMSDVARAFGISRGLVSRLVNEQKN